MPLYILLCGPKIEITILYSFTPIVPGVIKKYGFSKGAHSLILQQEWISRNSIAIQNEVRFVSLFFAILYVMRQNRNKESLHK